MNIQDMTLLIVCGGKSTRMGRDKRYMTIDGISWLERMLQEGRHFKQTVVCTDKKTDDIVTLCQSYQAVVQEDQQHDVGPMEGLYLGLVVSQTEYSMAVSVDMPLWRASDIASLWDGVEAGHDVYVPSVHGHWHPLAAVYHKSMVPVLRECLRQRQYALQEAIRSSDYQEIVCHSDYPFINVNTLAQWRLVEGHVVNRHKRVPTITVSANQSNTGKTTVIEQIVQVLEQRGYTIGVVKSDSHGYDLDESGKDSWRYKQAGAQAVAVVSPNGYFIEHRTVKPPALKDIATTMVDMDIVLIETRSKGVFPRLLVHREGYPCETTDDTVAIVSCDGDFHREGYVSVDLADEEMLANVVLWLSGKTEIFPSISYSLCKKVIDSPKKSVV